MASASRLVRFLAMLFALAMLATACGSDGVVDSVTDAADSAADAAADAVSDDDDDASEAADEPAPADDPEPAEEPDDEPEPAEEEPADDEPADAAALVPEIDTLRICQAASFGGMASHIAVTKGLLEAKGITGEFIACESGPANAAALISRQVDVVGNTPDNALGIRAADFDVVMFAQALDTHFFDIIVREGIEVDCDQGDWECTMQALDGMNVGVVARGAAAELIAVDLLKNAGLNPDDSTYIATGLAGTTLAALASGEVDWAITFEPGLSTGVADGIGFTPFNLRAGEGPDSLDWPSLVLTTSRAVWDESPNAITLYNEALLEAIAWMRDDANRDDVLAEMNSFLGVEGELAEAILDNNIGSFTTTGALDPERLTNNAQFAFDNGRIPEVYEFGTYAVGPGIDAIVPDALVPETDTVQVCSAPSFGGMPTHIANAKGIFEAAGLTVEFIACESGPANAAALVSGEVTFVGNTPDNMLGLRAADFDVVMYQQVIDKHFFDIIVSEGFGAIDCEQGDWECTMAALDGTNVGVVARGAAAEQIARELYESAGLDPESATYIATGLAGTTLAALASGEIDWAITFEPGLSQGVTDGIGYTPFALRAGDGPPSLDWPSLVATTSREFYDANPNTVSLYGDSIRTAMDWMRNPANRDEVLAEMNTFLGIEGELAEAILDNNIGSFSLNGRLDPARLQNNVDYAVKRGILEEAIAVEDFTVGG